MQKDPQSQTEAASSSSAISEPQPDANPSWLCRWCYGVRGYEEEMDWRQMYGVPPRPDAQCDSCGRLPSLEAIVAAGLARGLRTSQVANVSSPQAVDSSTPQAAVLSAPQTANPADESQRRGESGAGRAAPVVVASAPLLAGAAASASPGQPRADRGAEPTRRERERQTAAAVEALSLAQVDALLRKRRGTARRLVEQGALCSVTVGDGEIRVFAGRDPYLPGRRRHQTET
jgi:hypothetical protein